MVNCLSGKLSGKMQYCKQFGIPSNYLKSWIQWFNKYDESHIYFLYCIFPSLLHQYFATAFIEFATWAINPRFRIIIFQDIWYNLYRISNSPCWQFSLVGFLMVCFMGRTTRSTYFVMNHFIDNLILTRISMENPHFNLKINFTGGAVLLVPFDTNWRSSICSLQK